MLENIFYNLHCFKMKNKVGTVCNEVKFMTSYYSKLHKYFMLLVFRCNKFKYDKCD